MLTWSSVPPNGTPHTIPLVRVPPHTAITGTILSDQMIGTWVHFYGGRSYPCRGENCPACEDDIGSRWKAYLHILQDEPPRQIILEITEHTARALADQTDGLPSLRGIRVRFSRRHPRRNAPVDVRLSNTHLPADSLPPSLDIPSHLERIWGIKRKRSS
ncbi:hypothetical protein [uncultured Thermanaerothrix sp.]|uniref:hypothetical protein n=1 Tax=uncultured Thermanaerothrix sp. TaxID=1195149 RepID=UPI002633E285|nr:hypothetical protein [uncultured Thermanaerothrix sp.]